MKMTEEQQIANLRQMITIKRIDAWDLGFEQVLSPGAIDEALAKLY